MGKGQLTFQASQFVEMSPQFVNSEVNARRIANVEACFGGTGQQLAAYGRVLVGEGVLVKMCRKKPKPRQFFLFNDILVYGNILISKKRYNKQHLIPLEEVQLQNLEDEGGGKKAATEHAAVWIPDGEATKCMACRRTQFTVLQRRHHCRACGNVVCAACSTHNYRIQISKRPVRVCDLCFSKFISKDSEVEHIQSFTASSVQELSESEDEDKNTSYDHEPTFYSKLCDGDNEAVVS